MLLSIKCTEKFTVAEQALHLLGVQKQPVRHIEFTELGLQIAFSPLNIVQQSQILEQIRPLEGVEYAEFSDSSQNCFDHIIAESPKMRAVVEQAKKFAMLSAPLLIQGETGTGKDVFAKACHELSTRREHKFIAVNCAGLPADEAESEMFGHRGNGKENIGFFEYANGGTVLLDSIAELSLEMQAKLLRFLNDGCFRRVGEDQEIKVDVRVICTSQKPLALLVSEGKVREDLYHRLNVLSLELPPLRERHGDLPLLADHFITRISQQLGISKLEYDDEFLQALQAYRWPGNLRELYNAVYRACTLSHSYRLAVKDLNLPNQVGQSDDFQVDENATLDELVNRFEASLLRKLYNEYPSTRKLAQRLGVSHTAVANKLRAYGIGK
ncbi:sigma 54-interacting transcriptional regulator [Actinobacillus pleuropneumoniae]|uniref:HTH-type transcriptional regulatory protein TyrR n=2 Tax=Actinobacillus pleuropneumoniae TaxID=715 RepID=B0BP78_ACTPJ|nr:sigma 54-interacting transcriptional regulator [Actinobacillus pleuropneumoniae]ABY69363.1 transcriptional regulatory protein [Actinobacillus pleuropneumoniae serovar 3 str. JL03]EFL78932.1 transcriptional regulatory protein [Actinobacillus pleuropneumoniae serovar 2 str. 4226]EFM87889.1 Transcriptional regulatory protein tyrR [Actinobacillus pleuropneumoniae serovar 2 str. S1536]EFM90029.1 Transcriptional regulatory protein tyrR [Actinobacillus pleuropneumoniae serovar 4 str. M62]EFM96485.